MVESWSALCLEVVLMFCICEGNETVETLNILHRACVV